jgi:hypothetical protein
MGRAEYNLRYAALPTGAPGSPPNFVVRATRGLGGAGSIIIGNIDGAMPPTELRISRNGNTLNFSYGDSTNTLQTVGSIDLTDPLGDGSVDDSEENAEFILYPSVDGSVDNIGVKGDPMHRVNFSPDAQLPAGSATGLAALLAFLVGAGATALRRRRQLEAR